MSPIVTCAIINFKTNKYLAQQNQTFQTILHLHDSLAQNFKFKKGIIKTYQIGIQMKSCW